MLFTVYLTGPVGTIVTWTNKTTSPVVVKSATGLFVSPSIIPGGTYVYGFHAVDTYKYEVTGLPHSLSGMINIVAAPAGGVGPGAVVPANAQIIWATDTGFQPQLLVKPVGTTFTWKNISNDPLVITSQTPACIPSFNLPLGGVFTYTTTGVACSAKYTDQMNHLGGIKLN